VPVQETDNVQQAGVEIRSVSRNVKIQESQEGDGIFGLDLGNVHFEKFPTRVVQLKVHSELK